MDKVQRYFLIFLVLIGYAFMVVKADFNYPASSTDSIYQRENSLVKPYQASGMTIPNWEFFGSTIVTSNYIRLTQDAQGRQGGIWNVVPYQSKYWEVEVTFRIHGHGSELFGDGVALWYVKEPPRGGPIFGNKDRFTGLAVILDTYANQNGGQNAHGHPKISTMVNNGTLHYDHESDGVNTELSSCECKFRGLEHEARILVQYLNEELIVKTDLENSGMWRDCVSVKVYLPTHYHFGITAATGDLSDNHDILAIKMRQLSSAIFEKPNPDDLPRADYSMTNRDKMNEVSSGMSALRKLFIVVCVIAGVVAVAGFGFFLYQSKKNSARKRFY